MTMATEEQIRVLMQVHELEKSLGELYALLAAQFAECRDFWLRLAQEEDGHAEAVRRLYQLSYEGRSLFDKGAIRTEAIQSVLSFVRDQIDIAKSGRITVQSALSLTHDLEKSLIEKDIFAHVSVAPELSKVLARLKMETTSHIRRAQDERDRLSGTR